MFPDAPFIPRPGEINAWDNTEFVDAVKVGRRAAAAQRSLPAPEGGPATGSPASSTVGPVGAADRTKHLLCAVVHHWRSLRRGIIALELCQPVVAGTS